MILGICNSGHDGLSDFLLSRMTDYPSAQTSETFNIANLVNLVG